MCECDGVMGAERGGDAAGDGGELAGRERGGESAGDNGGVAGRERGDTPADKGRVVGRVVTAGLDQGELT